MSFRLSNLKGRCGGIVVAACFAAGGVSHAADGPVPAGRAIEFSDPKTTTLVTNLNQLGLETPDAHHSEPDFSTLQPLVPASGSLGGIMPPAPSGGSMISHRRSKDSFDPNGNWASQTPEEMMHGIVVKEMLSLPDYGMDGEAAQPPTRAGGIHDRTSSVRRRTDDSARIEDEFSLRNSSERRSSFWQLEESNPLLGVSERPEQSLKNLLGANQTSRLGFTDGRPNSLLEAFGLTPDENRENDLSPENVAKKARESAQIQRYQDLLDGGHGVLTPLPNGSSPGANPWLGGRPVAIVDPLNPFAAVPGSAVNPALLPPVTPPMPIPSSLAPIPYEAPAARTPAPKPNFSVPQRVF